jgi:PAS domain S-box-containing protein
MRGEPVYRELFENASDLVFTYDLEGRLTSINPAGERLTGYTREEATGKNVADVVAPEYLGLIHLNGNRKPAGERPSTNLVDIITKDGRRVPVEFSSWLICRDGHPVGVQGIGRDLSERRILELLVGGAGLREVLDAIAAWVERQTGPMKCSVLLPDAAEGKLRHGSRGSLPDMAAGPRSANCWSTPILSHDRRVLGVFALYCQEPRQPSPQDVQLIERASGLARMAIERKTAEEALVASAEQYRALFEGNPHPMFVFDLETLRFLAVNDAAVDHYGYSRAEFLTMTVQDLRPPEDVSALLEDLAQATQEVDVRALRRHRKKNGTILQAEIRAHSIQFNGRRARLVTAQDLTERLQLEGQLRHAQKMEAVGRLAGGIAHDFNNLLTAINGYSELLLEELDHRHPRRRQVEEIRKAGERAAALTQQLLAFSRRQVLQPKILDLNLVVAGMEDLLRRLIGEDVELVTALDPGLGSVEADPGQIEQVIVNLAVNARDAMPQGGCLRIQTANAPDGRVVLSVGDTGCGMDRETMSHLFEPFFTTKGHGKGTGLGLSTVYGIAEQSGGRIEVESEQERGSIFRISFPRARHTVPTAAAAPSRKAARGSETILLVEDEEVVRGLVRRILETRGYKVIEAGSADQALSLYRRSRGHIDLLVTDVIMPGMSGCELYRRLADSSQQLKVLYTSGYTGEAIAQHGALEPGIPLLEKPFTVEGLASKVREVLG